MSSPAKTELFERVARVGKAMGHPARLELLDLLGQGECPVEPLAAAAGLRLSTASAHLQVLRRAGLVTTRRAGTSIRYSLAGDDVATLYAAQRAVAAAHLDDLEPARRAFLGLTTNDPQTDPAVQEISREELLRRVRDGHATVLDVRPAREYAAGHIPGAISIPADELADRFAELPTATTVVAYCRGPHCVLSYDAVRLLTQHGRNAIRLVDGMPEWRLSGLPVAHDPAA
ncbi:ArsR/SmtB family transcription factor [Pseudonocardia sp. TRM90224]|uniref:ArsR/SmtB family transcription factor n=1 Tax=Pseudonocardia sp. TRM90224 TaxID=2812678 RepID=UPI001E330FAD|nr:metalloregulator ArsR/SmtB family transcription factor [Pseudonocardia sp. TRM90224]